MRPMLIALVLAGCSAGGSPVCIEGAPTCPEGDLVACRFDGTEIVFRGLLPDSCRLGNVALTGPTCDDGIAVCPAGTYAACITQDEIGEAPNECE